MRKFGSFLFGLLTGAMIGGTLALLFTPLEGSAVRSRIDNSFTHVQNEVKKAAKDRMDELNNQLAQMQNKPIE